jgi:hypothetical protein
MLGMRPRQASPRSLYQGTNLATIPSVFVSVGEIAWSEANLIRGTEIGSGPNGIKLSSTTLLYQCFACLSVWSGSPQVSLGQHVTARDSIYFDRATRRLPRGRSHATIDKKRDFD